VALKRMRLVQRRKALGHTQESLADRLGCERTTVIRWERAETEPQPWLRSRLIQALQLTAGELNELLADVSDVPGTACRATPAAWSAQNCSVWNLAPAPSSGTRRPAMPTSQPRRALRSTRKRPSVSPDSAANSAAGIQTSPVRPFFKSNFMITSARSRLRG
jgi:transcriptional regulator with XRE-family HTH domain